MIIKQQTASKSFASSVVLKTLKTVFHIRLWHYLLCEIFFSADSLCSGIDNGPAVRGQVLAGHFKILLSLSASLCPGLYKSYNEYQQI